jgi:ABC-type lipoprotein export system ATPase subunit
LDALALFRNKHIGVVFQEYNLIPEYTVKQNIVLPTVFSKVKQNNAFDEIVEKLGIGHLLDKKAKLLSGGEQQRVAVARAIINKPALVLADEPTGNLDPDNAEQLYEMLLNINQTGTTVIIVTHNIAMAEKFNTVYELKSGQLHKIK